MFEITIWVTKKAHLDKILQDLALPIKSVNGVYATTQKENFGISFAIPKLYQSVFKKKISSVLAEILCLGYKADYFSNSVNLADNEWKNLIVGTMSFFDNTEDLKWSKTLFDWEHPIYLEGYFNFLMQPIKSRWQEIVSLASHHKTLFQDAEVAKEFLVYLAQSMPYKMEKLSLECCLDQYHLFDEKEQLKVNLWNFLSCATPQEMAFLDVVKNKPKELKIYQACDFFDKKTLALINEIFDVKLLEKS